MSWPPTSRDQTVNQYELLDELNRDESSWDDVKSYPSTITARRMIRLANFAAGQPKRWRAIYLHHVVGLDREMIAVDLKVSERQLARYLEPVNFADPDDFPDVLF